MRKTILIVLSLVLIAGCKKTPDHIGRWAGFMGDNQKTSDIVELTADSLFMLNGNVIGPYRIEKDSFFLTVGGRKESRFAYTCDGKTFSLIGRSPHNTFDYFKIKEDFSAEEIQNKLIGDWLITSPEKERALFHKGMHLSFSEDSLFVYDKGERVYSIPYKTGENSITDYISMGPCEERFDIGGTRWPYEHLLTFHKNRLYIAGNFSDFNGLFAQREKKRIEKKPHIVEYRDSLPELTFHTYAMNKEQRYFLDSLTPYIPKHLLPVNDSDSVKSYLDVEVWYSTMDKALLQERIDSLITSEKALEILGKYRPKLFTRHDETGNKYYSGVMFIDTTVLMTGKNIAQVVLSNGEYNSTARFRLLFNEEGTKEFSRFTDKYRSVATVIDGILYTEVTIHSQVTTGDFELPYYDSIPHWKDGWTDFKKRYLKHRK